MGRQYLLSNYEHFLDVIVYHPQHSNQRGIIGFSATDPGQIALNRLTVPQITTPNPEKNIKKEFSEGG